MVQARAVFTLLATATVFGAATGSATSPPVTTAAAIIGPGEVVTLSWVPPAVIVPDGYKVYGKNESETSWTTLQTIPDGKQTYTTLVDQYDRYGVATIVDDDESVVVIASNMQLPCISVYPFEVPPNLEVGCWTNPLN